MSLFMRSERCAFVYRYIKTGKSHRNRRVARKVNGFKGNHQMFYETFAYQKMTIFPWGITSFWLHSKKRDSDTYSSVEICPYSTGFPSQVRAKLHAFPRYCSAEITQLSPCLTQKPGMSPFATILQARLTSSSTVLHCCSLTVVHSCSKVCEHCCSFTVEHCCSFTVEHCCSFTVLHSCS